MRIFSSIVLTAAIVMFASFGVVEAKTKKEKAMDRCDLNFSNCNQNCVNTLIDIDTAIRDCENRCQIKHARCTLKADRLGPTQYQPGNSNSDAPVLSTE